MARGVVASGTNNLGPNFVYKVSELSTGQLEIVLQEDADKVTIQLDTREQLNEMLQDLRIQANSIGHR